MGSFAYTCSVSGLPILAGDKVRYCALIEGHDQYKPACMVDDNWRLRTFPISAQYNDYGSIEDIAQPFLAKLFFDGLDTDVIERGTGDNEYHDLPVTKGMSNRDWLHAIEEGRVICRKYYDEDADYKPSTLKLHPSIPTMRRVKKIITKAKLNYEYLVSRYRFGFIRIRASMYENDKECRNALEVLLPSIQSKFSAMITASKFNTHAEMLVAPKPNEDSHIDFQSMRVKGRQTVLHITSTMIREDVWQALLAIELNPQDFFFEKIDSKDSALAHIHKQVRKFWEFEFDKINKPKSFLEDLGHQRGIVPSRMYGSHITIFGYSIYDAWMAALSLGSDIDEDTLNDFLNTVAETLYVQMVLDTLRYHWMPGSICGPQFGDWKAHKQFNQSVQKIIEKEMKRDE